MGLNIEDIKNRYNEISLGELKELLTFLFNEPYFKKFISKEYILKKEHCDIVEDYKLEIESLNKELEFLNKGIQRGNNQLKELVTKFNYDEERENMILRNSSSVFKIYEYLCHDLGIIHTSSADFYFKFNNINNDKINIVIKGSNVFNNDVGMFFYYLKHHLEQEYYNSSVDIAEWMDDKFNVNGEPNFYTYIRRYIAPYTKSTNKPKYYHHILQFFDSI